MKFLLDENLSPLHARTLRALGSDAISVAELGLSGVGDFVVRDAAIKQERILVTLDAWRTPSDGFAGFWNHRIFHYLNN